MTLQNVRSVTLPFQKCATLGRTVIRGTTQMRGWVTQYKQNINQRHKNSSNLECDTRRSHSDVNEGPSVLGWYSCRRFGTAQCFCLHGQAVQEEWLLDLESEGTILLQNVGKCLPVDTRRTSIIRTPRRQSKFPVQTGDQIGINFTVAFQKLVEVCTWAGTNVYTCAPEFFLGRGRGDWP
jgi:hypothetical protein